MRFIRTTRRWMAAAAVLPLMIGVAACGDDDPVAPTPQPNEFDAPSGVTAAEVAGGIEVSWNAVAEADGYTVQREEVGGSGFADIAEGVTGTSYLDNTAVAGVTYLYRVLSERGSEKSDPSTTVQFTIGLAVATLSSSQPINGTRRLSKDTTYILQGTVIVESGGVLEIEAGTTILGSTAIAPTALIVRVGGQLIAQGTAAEPIVFTSDKPVGSRARGDWGGVVLAGDSFCNFPAGQCIGEGASGPYGGTDVNDNSGTMSYVRIEYAGYEVSFGNELNALTLNGVGAGTQLSYIQAHYGLDDGIEFFGGTVDLKYAIVTGASDDSFDYSTGWQGRGQFWVVQQDPNDADNGFEVDGNEDDPNATPLTTPLIYNVTLVGKGSTGSASESVRGMLLRRGTAGDIYNAIVVGFGDSGIDIDQVETVGRITVQNSIFWQNAENYDSDSDGIDEASIMTNPAWGNRVVAPNMAAAFNRTNPDFRPAAGSPARSGAATPPNDGFFTQTDYLGGVDPDGPQWFEGWITTDQS